MHVCIRILLNRLTEVFDVPIGKAFHTLILLNPVINSVTYLYLRVSYMHVFIHAIFGKLFMLYDARILSSTNYQSILEIVQIHSKSNLP